MMKVVLQRWSLAILHEEKLVKQTKLQVNSRSSTSAVGGLSETKELRGVAQACERSPTGHEPAWVKALAQTFT